MSKVDKVRKLDFRMSPCKNFLAKKKSELVGFFGKKDLERFLKIFF